MSDIPRNVVVRRARANDVAAITMLVNGYAAEDVMLPRTPEQIALALESYVVATDARGGLLACAALREYAPSLVELVSVAVSRDAHGMGLGRVVVEAAQALAVKRGFGGIFAHTLTPRFFEAIGYAVVERARFPEKQARPHTACMWRTLPAAAARRLRVAA
jgi:amino-acid N-acetyltransferase